MPFQEDEGGWYVRDREGVSATAAAEAEEGSGGGGGMKG
jgi:hypothetical protein